MKNLYQYQLNRFHWNKYIKYNKKKKKFFKPFIFSANKNYRLICKQIIEFKPIYFVIDDKETFKKISKKFKKVKQKL